MSGGFSRLIAPWYVCVMLALAVLSGCSLFSRAKPVQVIPAPPLKIVTQEGPPASEAAPASAPQPASEAPAVTAKPRVPKKPRHFVRRRPPPEKPVEPAPPPPAPAPLITTEAVPRTAVQGLLDSKVQRAGGKIIGRAVDMLVDAQGKAQQMMVNLSGFLGIGDRKLNFPWSDFRFTPALDKKPIMMMYAPADMAAAKEPKNAPPAPPLLPLMDQTVQRKDGSPVGRVVDVLIDAAAQPRALVLDVNDSSIPLSVRDIAANWSALSFVTTKNHDLRVQMDLSKAQIKAAPLYGRGKPILLVSPAAAAAAPASSTRSPR